MYIHECNTIAESAKRPRVRKHQGKEHRRRRWLDGGLVNCGGAKVHRRRSRTAATTALARTQVGDKRHTERDRETRMEMHIEHRTHYLTLKSNKNRNNKEQQRTPIHSKWISQTKRNTYVKNKTNTHHSEHELRRDITQKSKQPIKKRQTTQEQ